MTKRKQSWPEMRANGSRASSPERISRSGAADQYLSSVERLVTGVVQLGLHDGFMPSTADGFMGLDYKDNLNRVLEDYAVSFPGDFSSCEYIQRFKRKGEGFIERITCRPRDPAEQVLSTLRSAVASGDVDSCVLKEFGSALGQLMKSKLLSIRFVALAVSITLLPAVSKHRNYEAFLNQLLAGIGGRCQDTCELVRRLAVVEGVCRMATVVGKETISDELLCASIEGMLCDPSRFNRLRMLSTLSTELVGNRSNDRLLHVSARIGAAVGRRCFDADDGVAVSALRLLSHEHVGEAMLGSDESLYQRISTLVWRISDYGTDPFRVAREALVFNNTHILASPGLLAESRSPDQQLAMLIEFLVQYSDGHIAMLTGRLVCVYISLSLTRKRSPIVVLSSYAYVSFLNDTRDKADSQHLSQQIDAKIKISAALEVLLAVAKIVDMGVVEETLTEELRDVLSDLSKEYEESNQGPMMYRGWNTILAEMSTVIHQRISQSDSVAVNDLSSWCTRLLKHEQSDVNHNRIP